MSRARGSTPDKALSKLPCDRRPYDVGYAKPPVATRFRQGTSGNPRGRPRGAKNKLPAMGEERLKSIVLEEAYRAIPIHEGNRSVTIPIAQAVIRALAVNAAKGNSRAQRLFTELLAGTETSRRRDQDALLEAAINYKHEWEKEFARCRRLGLPEPDAVPHPDHVVIDIRGNSVRFAGPVTREEKAEFDMWVERKPAFQEELKLLEADLADENDEQKRKFLKEEIASTQKVLGIIRQAIPD